MAVSEFVYSSMWLVGADQHAIVDIVVEQIGERVETTGSTCK